jgi:hypothetical protein
MATRKPEKKDFGVFFLAKLAREKTLTRRKLR